jgi:phytoene synthase
MTPQEYCQKKAGQSGSSFYYSFMLLERARRGATIALYAFCREVDDVVDECEHAEVAAAKLAWWRQEIADVYAGRPNHPVTRALVPAITAYELPQEWFQAVIDGMEMDLTHNRYATFDELKVYCHRVASVVGLLSASIFGYSDKKTLNFAENLGLAFQLTNIVRDVGEDARRNRIYLPTEDLQRFDVPAADILTGKETEAFGALMAFEGTRADEYYERAFAMLPDADRLAQVPSLVMAAIYRTNLAEIRADGYRVLKQKTTLPALRKAWLAWKTARQERRRYRQWRKRNAASSRPSA